MTDAPAKHPYHLVDPSPWPIMGAFSALALTFGMGRCQPLTQPPPEPLQQVLLKHIAYPSPSIHERFASFHSVSHFNDGAGLGKVLFEGN